MNGNSRYDEAIINPIREEFKAVGIEELTSKEAVKSFFAAKDKTAVLFINSVCGCSAATARPGFIESLKHAKAPLRKVSVFAGVDADAVASARDYFADIPPSSPSIALFREGELIYFIERRLLEGPTKELLTETLNMAYEKFFGDSIDDEKEIKNPLQLVQRDVTTAKNLLTKSETTLLDVRDIVETEAEPIPLAKLVDEALAKKIVSSWDKGSDLSFICSHGERSLQAAFFFRKQGFQKAFSVEGGRVAWMNSKN